MEFKPDTVQSRLSCRSVIINLSEKMQKNGRSTGNYLSGFIPPEGVFLNYRCYSSTFLNMQQFLTEI